MSKRKPLLTESELRRFMKLATLQPISNNRLEEMEYPGARDEDDELESELHATEDELGAEDHEADAEGDELEADDLAMDDEGPVEGGEEDLVVSLLQAIQGWAEEHGVEMDLEGGEEEVAMDDLEGGEEMELDAELPVDGGEEELELDAEEVMEEKDPEWGENEDEFKRKTVDGVKKKAGDVGGGKYGKGGHYKDYETNEAKVVEEVAKRVLARLQGEQKQTQIVDDLAERIMKRLTKK